MMGRLVCGFFLVPLFVPLVYSVGPLLIHPLTPLHLLTHPLCMLLTSPLLPALVAVVRDRARWCLLPLGPFIIPFYSICPPPGGARISYKFFSGALFLGGRCAKLLCLVVVMLLPSSIPIYYTARCVLVFSCDLGGLVCCVR
ncbi:hypothetical protein BJ912DRAFT_311353 [Pholiota molesta]|nr:hypothetical protein BJ912DRAFT_311353 [Pholiota molesta]